LFFVEFIVLSATCPLLDYALVLNPTYEMHMARYVRVCRKSHID